MKHTATRKILSLLLALILTASLLPATTAKAAEPPVTQHLQRLGSLDLTAATVPYCKNDGSWANVSPTQPITDCQEGWAWYPEATDKYAAKTLILDGVYIGAVATEGLRVPDGTHIILTEGSVNYIYVLSFDEQSVTTGISAVGALTVSTTGGEATMNIEAHYGLQPNGETKLNNVNFYFSHPEDSNFSYALYGYAASVEINGGSMQTVSGVGGMETTFFRAVNCTLNITAERKQSGLMTRESARFNNCTASFTGGLGAPGVRCMGEVFSALDSTLTFTGNSLVIPYVYTYPGYGMHIDSTMTLYNTAVTATAGRDANALYLDAQWNTPHIEDGCILNLTSVNAPALYSKYDDLYIDDSTVNARTTESGHAIQLPKGNLNVTRSTVNATAAGEGSAIHTKYVLRASASTLNLTAGNNGGDAVSSSAISLSGSNLSAHAPAGAGLVTTYDLTAKASDMQVTSAKTALSAAGSISLLNTTATLQSTDKTAFSAGGTLSIAEPETPYNISGASVSGPLTGDVGTTKITQTGSPPVVLSPKADTRPVTVHKILPRTTQLNLDLKSPVTYQNIYGTTTTIDPLYNDITDCAEGWSWYCKPTGDYPARTLVLNGFTLDLTFKSRADITPVFGQNEHHLVRLGNGITVHLADGSQNTISGYCDIDMSDEKNPHSLDLSALQVGDNCTLTGGGTLNVSSTAEAYSRYCVTYGLQGPWIFSSSGYGVQHIGTQGGSLTVKDATLKVHTTGPQNQGSALDNLTVDGGSTEISSSSTKSSALSVDQLTLHGGTLRIPSGGNYGLGKLAVQHMTVDGGVAYLNSISSISYDVLELSGGAVYAKDCWFSRTSVSGGILCADPTSDIIRLTGGVTTGTLRAYEEITIQDDACVIATEIKAQEYSPHAPAKTVITIGSADKPLTVANAKDDTGTAVTQCSGAQSFGRLTGTDYPNPLVINPHLAPDSYNTASWATKEVRRAEDRNLLPGTLRYLDMKESITREQFAMIAVLTYEALSGQPAPDPTGLKNPFIDTNSPWIIQAYHLNLVTGMTDVRYEPTSTMTREQAATLLTRVYKRSTMAGWTLESDGNYKLSYTKPAPFADDAKIASWARDNVYFMAANKVINGVGGNRFDPKGTASVQEALVIALRIIDTFGK